MRRQQGRSFPDRESVPLGPAAICLRNHRGLEVASYRLAGLEQDRAGSC